MKQASNTERAAKTTLRISTLAAPIGLIKVATSKSSLPTFEKAGPNGKRLIAGFAKNGERIVDDPAVVQAEQTAKAGGFDPLATARDAVTGTFERAAEKEEIPPEILVRAGERVTEEIVPAVFEEGSNRPLREDEIVRGVRREDGSFRSLETELVALKEMTHLDEMTTVGFFDRRHLPLEAITGAYYVAPTSENGVASAPILSTLFWGMKEANRVALVKWTKRAGGRQSAGVLVPRGSALVLLEIEFTAQLREPGAKPLAIHGYHPTPAEIEAAKALVGSMKIGPGALEFVEDDEARIAHELYDNAMDEKATVVIRPLVQDDEGLAGDLLAAIRA